MMDEILTDAKENGAEWARYAAGSYEKAARYAGMGDKYRDDAKFWQQQAAFDAREARHYRLMVILRLPYGDGAKIIRGD